MLHHLLPDLIPPIDRQYTFSFFTGRKMVPGDRAAFLDWFPQLASIGTRCQEQIRDTINRGIHGYQRSQSDRQRHHGLHATTAPTRL